MTEMRHFRVKRESLWNCDTKKQGISCSYNMPVSSKYNFLFCIFSVLITVPGNIDKNIFVA